MKDLFDLLAGTADGVYAVDRQQQIVFWNDAARRILGFEANAACGRNCFELLHGKQENGGGCCQRQCAIYRDVKRRNHPPTVDIAVNTRRRERKWISLTTLLMPSNWSGLSLLVHLFRDASQSREIRSRLEQELREADPPSEQPVASPLLMPLTPREVEVLRMLVGGASTESICRRLRIGRATVRSHVQHILAKLGVRSRLEAAALAVQHSLV